MNDFAAALISGGRSRRMGTDKAFLVWQGRPLWECQFEKLRALEPAELLLSCRAEQEFPFTHGVTRVHDEQKDCGPLAGVANCLRACEAQRLVVLGVDMPHLPEEFLRSLLAHSARESGAVVMKDGYFEPLAAVYPRAVLALAEQQLAAGRLAMQDFIRRGMECGMMRCVDLAVEPEWFVNWNAPGDAGGAAGTPVASKPTASISGPQYP